MSMNQDDKNQIRYDIIMLETIISDLITGMNAIKKINDTDEIYISLRNIKERLFKKKNKLYEEINNWV